MSEGEDNIRGGLLSLLPPLLISCVRTWDPVFYTDDKVHENAQSVMEGCKNNNEILTWMLAISHTQYIMEKYVESMAVLIVVSLSGSLM